MKEIGLMRICRFGASTDVRKTKTSEAMVKVMFSSKLQLV